MLLKYDICFALKNEYGEYETKCSSLFEIDKIIRGFPTLQINLRRNKECSLRIKCPLCGENHNYNYKISDLTKREMIIGGCENLGIPLFYMGNNTKVLNTLSKLNNIKEKSIAMI